MRLILQGLRRSLRGLGINTRGQDLVEYALVMALMGLAAAAAMNSVAQTINQTFINIGAKLSAATS